VKDGGLENVVGVIDGFPRRCRRTAGVGGDFGLSSPAALRCGMTREKLMRGAVGGGDARGTERGGAGPLYPSQSWMATMQ
jgi:hypothetical protein